MGEIVKGNEVATIDVVLVTAQAYENDAEELILDTSNHIQVTIATETEDRVALIVKGKLIAQKPPQTTVTGNTIVLTDNVFNDKLVKLLQGGTIKYDEDGNFAGYVPPIVGSNDKGKIFKLRAYSAIYNAAGVLVGYERITYPNCQGTPVAFSSEDGTFRTSDYTINSAPANGEAPYELDIVKSIPGVMEMLTVVSNEGSEAGYTKVSVVPSAMQGNTYKYMTGVSVAMPTYMQTCPMTYSSWNGRDDIEAEEGNQIVIAEVDSSNKVVRAGKTTVKVAE